jgi:tRNA threonylcarbamoyladenosine biosynthesis protein TsaE
MFASMPSISLTSRGEHDTGRLGAALAIHLPAGSVVALEGPLGAGKTRLVQAWATALGVDPREVSSPTFVLCHEYHGRLDLYHFDAYRAKGPAEFWDLGIDEYYQTGGILVIEWASRVAECLPESRWEIAIEVTGPDERRFHITTLGDADPAGLARIAKSYTEDTSPHTSP